MIRAAADADGAILRGHKWHSHKQMLRQQPREHLARVIAIFTAVHSHKVGGRRQGRQPVVACNLRNPVTGCCNLGADVGQVVLVAQGGQRAGLADAAHAEMVADFVETLDQSKESAQSCNFSSKER